MGIFYWLICDDDRTAFELGKGAWGSLDFEPPPRNRAELVWRVLDHWQPEEPDDIAYWRDVAAQLWDYGQARRWRVTLVDDCSDWEGDVLAPDEDPCDPDSPTYRLVGSRFEPTPERPREDFGAPFELARNPVRRRPGWALLPPRRSAPPAPPPEPPRELPPTVLSFPIDALGHELTPAGDTCVVVLAAPKAGRAAAWAVQSANSWRVDSLTINGVELVDVPPEDWRERGRLELGSEIRVSARNIYDRPLRFFGRLLVLDEPPAS